MVYETSFLFLSSLASDELAGQVGLLKEIITSRGGEIISEEYPQMIGLSYPIRHRLDNKYVLHENANFGWVKYELDPEKAEEVKKEIDLIKTLVRYITVKTVKEQTFVSKDVFASLRGETMPDAPKELKPEVEEEILALDEEVDEELDKILKQDLTAGVPDTE